MNYIVKDLMVPISEYATVPEGATLFEAVLALEEAQLDFDRSKYHHRAILVLDKNKRPVGKLSQLNVLHSLGDDNEHTKNIDKLNSFGFSPQFIGSLKAQHQFQERTLEDICEKPAAMTVENFMKKLSPGEYVDEQASLESILPQLLQGSHLSLLVTREEEIVGILRMSDVFAAVFHIMKKCEKGSDKGKD